MSVRKNIYAWNLVFVIAAVTQGQAQQPNSQQSTAVQNSEQQQQQMPGMQMPEQKKGQNPQQQQCPEMPGMQMPCPQQQQQPKPGQQSNMQGMDHKQMPVVQMNMEEIPKTFVEAITHHGTSGTSAEPNSTPTPMLMTMRGKWMLMFHGVVFLNALQQSGPRGSDKVFSTNWIMPMAQRELGPGTFTVRTMLSFEPGTVTKRFYPELFQQGETAFGKAIVMASTRMISLWNWRRSMT